jgi:uncharacterized phage protein (TIGR02220 family)
MAKQDMRIDFDFVDHPKVRRLIKQSGYAAFYSLIKLFSMTAKLYQKGLLKDCDIEDIEFFSGWRGKSGEFVQSLLDVKFLDYTESGYEIHDWKDHQPWIFHAPERSKQAKEAISIRWAKDKNNTESTLNTDRNTLRITERNTPSPIPSPSPNPLPIPIPKPSPATNFPIDNMKSPEVTKADDKFPYQEIIAYLNEQCKSRYRVTESTKKLIHARFQEGFTKEDFICVIDNKVKTWKGNEWEKYLRPETLFCASKFQGYLNEKPINKKEKDGLNLYD